MIRKEIHVYLLAYNLLRSLMWSAGTTYNTPPDRLSLQGTRHHLINFIPKLEAADSKNGFAFIAQCLKLLLTRLFLTALLETNHESVNVARKPTP